jgi:hypothetical protein
MWGGFSATPVQDLDSELLGIGVPRTFSWTLSWFAAKATDLIAQSACLFGYCVSLDAYAEMVARYAVEGSDDPYTHMFGMSIPGKINISESTSR